jgi:hypothetical protein
VAQMNYEPVVDPAHLINPLSERQQKIDQSGEQFSRKVELDSDKLYFPNAQKLPTDLAEMYLLDDFLNRQECKNYVC